MKPYLVTMSILLAAALAAGIGVWYLYQDLNPATLIQEKGKDEVPLPVTGVEEEPTALPTEPVTVSTDSLTERQQATLKAFGVDSGEITITPAMILCAEAELGEVRFEEIINGAAPTPLEAVSLVPCMRAR